MEAKQVRLTLEDTISSQIELRKLVKAKRDTNKPVTDKEKEKLYSLLPKALLSQGTMEPCIVKWEGKIITFESTQTMVLRLMDIRNAFVHIVVKYPESIDTVQPITWLWSILYDKLQYLFPKALAEATRMSSEQLKRIQQGALDFDPNKKV